jgi:urease accessory protein
VNAAAPPSRLVAHAIAPPDASAAPPADAVILDHDGRTLRREVVTCASGARLLVDLAEATTLRHGDRLVLGDGRTVAVIAAPEDLAEIRGDGPHHLVRLAWHLGNRHLPTQIEDDRLLIRRDAVIERMLAGLGARVAAVREPFHPEGGAYAAHAHAPAAAPTLAVRAHAHPPAGGAAHGHHHHPHDGHAHDHPHGHDHDRG